MSFDWKAHCIRRFPSVLLLGRPTKSSTGNRGLKILLFLQSERKLTQALLAIARQWSIENQGEDNREDARPGISLARAIDGLMIARKED